MQPGIVLADLFEELFPNASELRRWLQRHVSDGDRIVRHIPGGTAGIHEVAFEAGDRLDRWGFIDARLFEALVKDFPGRSARIRWAAMDAGISFGLAQERGSSVRFGPQQPQVPEPPAFAKAISAEEPASRDATPDDPSLRLNLTAALIARSRDLSREGTVEEARSSLSEAFRTLSHIPLDAIPLPVRARALSTLAGDYIRLGQLDEARRTLFESLEVAERMPPTEPEAAWHLVATHGELAELAEYMGFLADAMRHWRQAEAAMRVRKPDDPTLPQRWRDARARVDAAIARLAPRVAEPAADRPAVTPSISTFRT